MDMLQAMALGALSLADEFSGDYNRAFKSTGFTEAEWHLLTQMSCGRLPSVGRSGPYSRKQST